MKKEIVALIPVREGSTRVKDKNFKTFADQESLLHLKIKQLKQADCFDHIYVSSDSKRAENISKDLGVEFLPRDPEMCKSSAKLYQYNTHMLETVPGEPVVAWTMVTAPLFDSYAEAVDKYFNLDTKEYDSLVAVRPFQEFLLNEKGRPVNCTFGHWHLLTQELDKYSVITGSIYIAEKSKQIEWKYWIGLKPYLYEVSKLDCVDVDFEDDFKLAEKLYFHKKGKF